MKINECFLGVEGFQDKSQSYVVASEGLLYVCVYGLTLDPSLYTLWVLFLISGCVFRKTSSIDPFNMCLDCFSPVRVASMSLLLSKQDKSDVFCPSITWGLSWFYAFNFQCMFVLILSYQSDVFFRVSAHDPLIPLDAKLESLALSTADELWVFSRCVQMAILI